jgi:2-hydroxy-3-keto-5-methylthiopentenyl-1-phosphate phosphatase
VVNHDKGRLALVLDWDGTATERDTLHMAITRFGDREVFDALEAEVGERMTLDDVIAAEMATIRAPLDEVVAWLVERVRMRPGFHELVAAHDPLIVSAGFHELIEPILAREGTTARIVANHVESDPGGWRCVFTEGAICSLCGERCKRSATAGLGPFAYVGDGVSDRCVSLQAHRRFARDGLAVWLEERGVGYEPFDDLYDVLNAVSRGAAVVPPRRRRGRKT